MTHPPPLALIVEDDEPTAEMFAEMLRISGFEAQRALNASEARAALSAGRP
jgi:DNA-binding response OmpR family regulator